MLAGFTFAFDGGQRSVYRSGRFDWRDWLLSGPAWAGLLAAVLALRTDIAPEPIAIAPAAAAPAAVAAAASSTQSSSRGTRAAWQVADLVQSIDDLTDDDGNGVSGGGLILLGSGETPVDLTSGSKDAQGSSFRVLNKSGASGAAGLNALVILCDIPGLSDLPIADGSGAGDSGHSPSSGGSTSGSSGSSSGPPGSTSGSSAPGSTSSGSSAGSGGSSTTTIEPGTSYGGSSSGSSGIGSDPGLSSGFGGSNPGIEGFGSGLGGSGPSIGGSDPAAGAP